MPGNNYVDHVDPDVKASVRRAMSRPAELGARPVDVEIPMTRYIRPTHWGLMVPEAPATTSGRCARSAPARSCGRRGRTCWTRST
ncbi:hypothetical protein [Streptomyces sp. NPDC090021]|uniref:hypothetical protein n=1 Tax=Streptomyces sp. NPDC090021 TaxID=3365919 RepID=UPI0038271D0D